MKYCLLTLVMGFLLGSRLVAQPVPPVPSPAADSLFTRMMSQINPRYVQWIRNTAGEVNRKNLGPDSVMAKSRLYGQSLNMNDGSIEAIAFLVLMQSAKSNQEDLKAIMAKVKAINSSKAKLREVQATLNNTQKPVTRMQLDSFRLVLQKQPVAKTAARSTSYQDPAGKQEISDMAARVNQELKSLSEMDEMESLRLQMAMDRQSKMMSTLSNLLKKVSETADSITQNLK